MTVVDYAGFLQSFEGPVTSEASRHYYELRGSLLYRWQSEPTEDSVPVACFDLTAAEVTENPVVSNSWCLRESGSSVSHVFVAPSEREMSAWMEKLRNIDPTHTQRLPIEEAGSHGEEEERAVFPDEMRRKLRTNDFDILNVIGKGSFGKVYSVRKKDTGEVFAMKIMNKAVVERENLTEHIFAEKSILQKINHPFIVKLRYAIQTPERLILVLDLLSGGEVFYHLDSVHHFPESRAKFYTAQIALAIGYLHSLDIIYRDLKPENAVLDKDGYVCLTDFGLAKMNVSAATANTFCGTPEYLAPEFLMGLPHGRAVDWWSLGIMLYEMLQGIPPFYDSNVNAMYEQILSAPLTFQEDVPISDDAKDLLNRLLDRNPETRLQNVDELRSHPFFHDIDFERLYHRKLPAPFLPDSNILNNFDDEFTTLSPDVVEDDAESGIHATVAGFTYDGDSNPNRSASRNSGAGTGAERSLTRPSLRESRDTRRSLCSSATSSLPKGANGVIPAPVSSGEGSRSESTQQRQVSHAPSKNSVDEVTRELATTPSVREKTASATVRAVVGDLAAEPAKASKETAPPEKSFQVVASQSAEHPSSRLPIAPADAVLPAKREPLPPLSSPGSHAGASRPANSRNF